MNKKKCIPALLLLAAAIIWGFAFAAQDAAGSLGAFTLGFARSILAGVFLIFIVMIFDKVGGSKRHLISKKGIDINKTELIGGAICGAVLALASALQQFGINSGTDGGKAAFITALYVVMVPIYALAMRKKASFNVWISVGIAVIGFYLLCIKDDLSIAPSDIPIILCALVFPVHILTIDRFSPRCDGIRMSMVQFFVCSAVNLLFIFIFELPLNITAIVGNIFPILYLGICSSGIAYTLQILGQKGTDPTVASIILSLESVFGVIGTALFLHQALSVREYIGCGVLLVAVLLSQIDISAIIKKTRDKNKDER